MNELIMRRREMNAKKVWNIIEFEDPVFKDLCVSKWGGATGGSTKIPGIAGEITIEQAAKVTSINSELKNRSSMTIVDFSKFTNLKQIGTWVLQGSTNVTKFIIPYSVTTLNSNMVYTQRHNILFIVGDEENGSDLTRMDGSTFGQARAVVCYRKIPPTFTGSASSIAYVAAFYVPDDAYDTYMADANWSKAKLKKISEFTG